MIRLKWAPVREGREELKQKGMDEQPCVQIPQYLHSGLREVCKALSFLSMHQSANIEVFEQVRAH